MPVERDIKVMRLYWSWVGGFIPYPFKKESVVVRWCYLFAELTIQRRFFFTRYEGRENGTAYKWQDWNWPLRFGLERNTGYTLCRKHLLTPV